MSLSATKKPNVERDKDKIILTESNRKHNLQK